MATEQEKTFDFDQTKLGRRLLRSQNDSGKGTKLRYCPTGFPTLDQFINGGLQPGLTVLGAIPNIGKSTLALQIAETIARNGTPVLFYSLEMTGEWVDAKAVSRYIFVQNEKNEKFGLSANEVILAGEKQREQINQAIEDLTGRGSADRSPIEFYVITGDGDKPITAEFIGENVKNFIALEQKRPVVFVDYLQVLTPGDRKIYSDSRTRTDAVIEKLVALAQGHNIPVFLISSLNRSSYDTAALMQGFKDTGLIEYSADLLLGLQMYAVHEPKYDSRVLNREKGKSPRDVEIVVLKQRYGPCGEDVAVRLDYYPKYNYFCESGGRKTKKSPWQTPGKSFFINNSLVMNKIRKGDYVSGENRDEEHRLRFEISEKVDAFDCALMDAVYTLQYAEKGSFNARDIYFLLAADPKSVSDKKRSDIEKRLARLEKIKVSVGNDGGQMFSGSLLPVEKISGKQCKYRLRSGERMPLYEYASEMKHIRRYPRAMLSMKDGQGEDGALRNTQESMLLKLCLLRKIDVLRYMGRRQSPRDRRRMQYETILEDALGRDGMLSVISPETGGGKKRRACIKQIRRIMDNFCRMGYIEDYSDYGEESGIEVAGEIADPNALILDPEMISEE